MLLRSGNFHLETHRESSNKKIEKRHNITKKKKERIILTLLLNQLTNGVTSFANKFLMTIKVKEDTIHLEYGNTINVYEV
jgi:hypothetical protein